MCRSISPPLFSLSSGQKKRKKKNTPSERRAASVCVCGPDGNVSSLGGCCGSCVCSWCAGSRRREWWKHRLLCGAPCARAPAAVLRVLARRPHVLCRRGRCRVPCHQQLWHWRRRRLCARLCRPRTGRRGVHRQAPCVPLRPALRRLCPQQLLGRLCSPSRVSRVCPSSLLPHFHTPTCCCCSLTTPFCRPCQQNVRGSPRRVPDARSPPGVQHDHRAQHQHTAPACERPLCRNTRCQPEARPARHGHPRPLGRCHRRGCCSRPSCRPLRLALAQD